MSGLISIAPDGFPFVLSSLGAKEDVAALADDSIASLIALFKRLLERQTDLLDRLDNSIDVNVLGSNLVEAGNCAATVAAITNQSESILDANPNRTRALILNLPGATTTPLLGFGYSQTVNNSIPLSPGLGWLESFSPLYKGEFKAMMASGSGNLLVLEWGAA